MRAIQANGQPAFAAWFRSRSMPAAPWAPHSLHVLSVDHEGISRITLFVGANVTRLFESSGLPATLADDPAPDLMAD